MTQPNSTIGKKVNFIDIEQTHTHDSGHLILPLQGTVSVQTGEQNMKLNQQQLALLPPHCQHTWYARERNECLVFFIPSLMFSNIHNPIEANFREMDKRWKALRLLLLNEVQDKRQNTAAINDLLYYSFRLMQQEREPRSIRYIHENYPTNISIETLANLEHYNVSYYSQWFQKKMGVTPQTYIQTVRLNEAKRLLRETDYSILAIAQQVGYEHQASLTRLFQQFEGTTPKLYRLSFYN
jgi:AraC-like DNA-binding protein